MRFIGVWNRVDEVVDILRIGRNRCVTLRLYPETGSYFSIRHLSYGREKWKRFALDIGRVSIVFENYNK